MDEKPGDAAAQQARQLALRRLPGGRGGRGRRGALGREHRRAARRRPRRDRPPARACTGRRSRSRSRRPTGPTVLIDGGANADARPEHLLQFAHMGSVFAEEALGIAAPRVALLSIGEEPEKGNRLVREAHDLLAPSRAQLHRQRRGARPPGGPPPTWSSATASPGNVALKTLEGGIGTTMRRAARGDRVEPAQQDRRPADPAGGPGAARPARSRDVRRRLPARPARPRRDRPRELVPNGAVANAIRARRARCRGPGRGARSRRAWPSPDRALAGRPWYDPASISRVEKES